MSGEHKGRDKRVYIIRLKQIRISSHSEGELASFGRFACILSFFNDEGL